MRTFAFTIAGTFAAASSLGAAPPALPLVFRTSVNASVRQCFVQCVKGSADDPCPKTDADISCPTDTTGLVQQLAYDYNQQRGWAQDAEPGLAKNFSQVTDVKTAMMYQLEPFAYPAPGHDVCSGYGAYEPAMPHWTISPNATLSPGTATIRGIACDHWRYEAPAGAAVPAPFKAHYARHVEDYFLAQGTNVPVRAVLDEEIVHEDPEWSNFTNYNTETHDYDTFDLLHGDEKIFDVSADHCKLMTAPADAAAAGRPTAAQRHAEAFWLTPLPRGMAAHAGGGGAAGGAWYVRTAVEASPFVVSGALVAQINAAQSSWTAAPSARFANMTKAAFKRSLMRQPPRAFIGSSSGSSGAGVSAAAVVPAAYDFRTAHPDCVWAKTIIDQGTCGSCWAWSASGVMSSRLCQLSNGTVNERMSPQWLMSCNDKTDMGCGGGALDNVWTYLATKGNGITTEACNPYDPWGQYPACPAAGACTAKGEEPRIFGASNVWSPAGMPGSPSAVAAIQAEILAHGPVEVGISLFSDFAAYSSGVYKLTVNESYGGGHAVEIIGWGTDDAGGGDYWTVQNTYGADWGEKGYFRIRRGTNEIGIEQEVIAGMPDVPAAAL